MRDHRTRTYVILICAGCLLALLSASCPAFGKPVSPDQASWFLDMNRFTKAAHARISCEKCHPDISAADKKHPDMKAKGFLEGDVFKEFDYARCQACHRSGYERYEKGEHAKARLEQAKPGEKKKYEFPAPVCGQCHEAHYAPGQLDRLDSGRRMTAVCGQCHPEQLATYLDNFHGKAAVNLGNTKSAFCTDCHGAHNTVSLKEPQKALNACLRCHPDANLKFAEFVIHPTKANLAPEDSHKIFRVDVIKLVAALMAFLVVLLIALYYGHTFLWMLREIHHQLRKHIK